MARRVRRAVTVAIAGGLTAALATATPVAASAAAAEPPAQPRAIGSGFLGAVAVTVDGEPLPVGPIGACDVAGEQHNETGLFPVDDVADFWGGTSDCTRDEQGNAHVDVDGRYFSTSILRRWGGPRIRVSSFAARCDTTTKGSNTVMELGGVYGLDLPENVSSNHTVTIPGPAEDDPPLAKVVINELIAPQPPDGSLRVNAIRIELFPEGGPASGEILVGSAACDPYGGSADSGAAD
ncbi:choice-of-anchor P family protein [Haloechinothrix halophila]|uniref:choice-of-anchor P family protein n=1 Tax=Haloechinothrix halophila TaxID=1069073 RepID=UPI0004290749|nr:choice-of-anchor P family protein [Haloechinothrix halophila]